jgi:hypothetical protein
MPLAPFVSSPQGRSLRAAAIGLATLLAAAGPALADKISHPTAVFDGLDKITGRIISFEVAINETVQFGTLQITPRVCYSRPPTEAPQTDAFTQVDEIDEKHEFKRIFSGWMFADSPGLHGVEHPIYDVWLTDCKGGTVVMHEAPQMDASTGAGDNPDAGTDAGAPTAQGQAPAQLPKKRKPKPVSPTVVSAPAPPQENAPLDLSSAPGTGGNSRGR